MGFIFEQKALKMQTNFFISHFFTNKAKYVFESLNMFVNAQNCGTLI